MSGLLANYRQGGKANLNSNLWKVEVAYRLPALKSIYLKQKFALNWFQANCWEAMLVMCCVVVVLSPSLCERCCVLGGLGSTVTLLSMMVPYALVLY